VPDITATVFVSGIGAATFTIPTINVVNQNLPAVGFSDPTHNLAILFANNNSVFVSYDLSTSIGLLTGTPSFNPFSSFETTADIFSISSVSDITFQAIMVPEPSIPRLLGFGFMCVTSQILRRRRLPAFSRSYANSRGLAGFVISRLG